MTVSILGYLACVVTLVAAATRVLDRHYTHRAGRQYLTAGQVCSALAVASWTHDSRRVAIQLHWPARLPFLTGNVLAMLAGFCLVATLAYTVGRTDHAARRTAAHGAGVAACCATSTTLALTGSTITGLLAQMIPPCYVAWCYARFAAGLIARSREPGTHLIMRLSLHTTTISACTRVGWAICQGSLVVIAALHDTTITAEPKVSELVAATAVSLGAIGTTLATWTPRVLANLEKRRISRAYRGIQPLWAVLTAARPDVVLADRPDHILGQDNSSDAVLDQLYQMVIEIGDARRKLRPYIDPAVTSHFETIVTSLHLFGRSAATFIQAAELACSLARHQEGAEPLVHRLPARPSPNHTSALAQARWLARIGHHLLNSPTILALYRPVTPTRPSSSPAFGDQVAANGTEGSTYGPDESARIR